ncbi:ABC transporter permease [Pedobacter chinensis]|uniref:ABC transporter permease n=1 Tax=Pedobacter chinensis TaxID=2282421 RepID=A0A369PVU0_9SPHI|nr:ABC transporter permease [Pedobacter chinensis]RDC56360.1 ABC transporter permease [Pedobacter chinensis]
MHNFWLLIRREFSLFWSNKIFVFAFIAMPSIVAFMLGSVYQQGRIRHQPVLIIDKDNSPMSAKLCEILSEHNSLHVLDKQYETVNIHRAMLNSRAVAVIVVPDNFEADLLIQKHPEINCYLNMSNTLTAGAVGNAVATAVKTLNAGILINTLQKKGIQASLAMQQQEAFGTNVFLQYNRTGNYLLYLWPGLIFSVLQQLLLLALAVSFSQEYSSNNFNKAGLLGISKSAGKLIFIKMVPYCILAFFTVLNYYLISIYYKIVPPQHPLVLLIGVFLMIISTSLLGIFYSIINPMPLKASQMLMSVASPAFTISGFTWPTEQMPVIIRWVSEAIPLIPFLKIMRLVFVQGAAFADALPHLLHLLALILVFYLLSLFLLKIKINKAIIQETMPNSATLT